VQIAMPLAEETRQYGESVTLVLVEQQSDHCWIAEYEQFPWTFEAYNVNPNEIEGKLASI
jgi:hypothetical protein